MPPTRYGLPMKEKIVDWKLSKLQGKKYKVIVQDVETTRERTIHFGGKGYEQFKDSTPLKKFASWNHGDVQRKRNYFNRHSGIPYKRQAVQKEIKKSKGRYNAKILSHIYLW